MQKERVCRNAQQKINGGSDIDVRSGIRQIYTTMYDPRRVQKKRNIEIHISLMAAVSKRVELRRIAKTVIASNDNEHAVPEMQAVQSMQEDPDGGIHLRCN